MFLTGPCLTARAACAFITFSLSSHGGDAPASPDGPTAHRLRAYALLLMDGPTLYRGKTSSFGGDFVRELEDVCRGLGVFDPDLGDGPLTADCVNKAVTTARYLLRGGEMAAREPGMAAVREKHARAAGVGGPYGVDAAASWGWRRLDWREQRRLYGTPRRR